MVNKGVVHGRFQVLHLKHMEYILAAKMRCEKLYIGITNPDMLHAKSSVYDINRGTKAGNPLSYRERCEMIRGALKEFGVPEEQYEIIPFPISYPEYITQYAPEDAVYYMGICDEWDREKYRILSELGLKIHVLWEKDIENKGITGSMIRKLIATDQDWAKYVPKSVYAYMKEQELDKRVKRLELMRIEEKMVIEGKKTEEILQPEENTNEAVPVLERI